MHPLTAFAHQGLNPPYRADSALVFPVRSKTGLVAARQGALVHLETGMAGIIADGRTQFGARFLCGEGSADVAILADASAHGGVCERCVDVAAGPCVYRCFSAAPALIYIGSAEKWLARLANHRAYTSWWAEVADVQITRYRSIFEARAAEVAAIKAEHPLRNKRHNTARRMAA